LVKKTDNKKTDNKKTDNKKTVLVITICAIISASALSLVFIVSVDTSENPSDTSENPSDTSENPSDTSENPSDTKTMSDYIENLSETHTIQVRYNIPYFDIYMTDNDFTRVSQYLDHIDGVRITFNPSTAEKLLEFLKPNDGTVVIYPIFTSAAYSEPGFYTYFGGYCDESCITDLSFENAEFLYTSSGVTSQVLYHAGYDFLTDIEVDKNPEILQNYDTVILLHNEYVTKKQFDAISSHPNLIFLHPNALYAEIDVNYDTNTMTLIRGHNYPEPEIANGFDYEIEQKFHHYEYDDECLEWEFIEIENGFHLNCYPDGVVLNNLDILFKLNQLTFN